MKPETLRRFARFVPYGSVPWFDRLEARGLLQRWVESESEETRKYAFSLFGEPKIIKERGGNIARLIAPLLDGEGRIGRNEAKWYLQTAHLVESPDLLRLIIRLIDQGEWDDSGDSWSVHLFDLGDVNPTIACELIAHTLDRQVRLAQTLDLESPFDLEGPFGPKGVKLPEGIVGKAANHAPKAFVETIVPRVISTIQAYEFLDEDGDVLDRAWPFRTFGTHDDFRGSLLSKSAQTLSWLAKSLPDDFQRIVAPFTVFPHQNIAYLLLTGWTGNPERFANDAVEYILADKRRLNLGYSIWSAGDGIVAISRAAVEASGRYCSDQNFRSLEKALLAFYPKEEKDDPKALGYRQFALLSALPETRLSAEGEKRLQELARKFPRDAFEAPYVTERSGWVGSPIPEDSARLMSDDQWLSAMLKYNSTEIDRRFRREDFLKGGGLELSRVLERLTTLDKPRYAGLCLKMSSEIQPFYFEALLRGLAASKPQQGPNQPVPSEPLPLIEDALFEKVIKHIYELVGPNVGRQLPSTIASRAEHPLSEDLLKMVLEYAQSDPDPLPETDAPNKGMGYNDDPLFLGLNSVRGSAAHAIASLLFADRSRLDLVEPTIGKLSRDPSRGVRAIAIECFLALLNSNHDLAVTYFLNATQLDLSVLSTHTCHQFLHYAVFSHYPLLQPSLDLMLSSQKDETRAAAARAIAVAAFSVQQAVPDLERVLKMDENCRSSVAEVDAVNFTTDECRDISRPRLVTFFSDPSREVRDHASRVIMNLTSEMLLTESELITSFLNSPAFEEHANMLLDALKKSDERLPDLVYRIGERAAEIHRKPGTGYHWWTNDVGLLVLRLYDQSKDPEVQRRCLDLIDEMIELGFGNIDPALNLLDR